MTIPMFAASDIITDDDRDTWCTPQEIVDALLRLWPSGPDLDPCANGRSIVPCRRRYTLADCIDVEAQQWRKGETVYCNPPYSNAGPWIAKCAQHEGSAVACIICDPSVGWWKDTWTADAICFPSRRIGFLPPPNVNVSSFNRPIALPFWASDDPITHGSVADFDRAFGPLGKVVHL